MKKTILMMFSLLMLGTSVASAEEPTLPKKVENVNILTLEKEQTVLPYFGEKNLMIFYIDPQAHKQNYDFTVELEETRRAEGPNIVGYGVLNMKDAWYPNSMVRKMARKRTAKNGALVLADQKHILRDAWGLGDCNDLFVLLVVNKAGELVYMHKGELSETDKEEFYKFIEQYR